MRFRSLAICLAEIATILILAYADAPHDSLATSPPSAQRFSIDLDPANFPANTATSLGSREPCATMVEDNTLDYDEDFVDTLEFDVTVIGIPPANAIIGYTYTLSYPAPSTRIVARQPMLINPPGIPPDPLPDTDGSFNVSVLDTSGTGVSGSGVLDRIRIETVPAVVLGDYPLTLSSAAHIDTSGNAWAPDTLDSAMIGVNTPGPCSVADLETTGQTATFPAQIAPGTDVQIDVDKMVRNNGPFHPIADARTTFAPPPGCTVNGQATPLTLNTVLGMMLAGTSLANEHLATVRCTDLGSYQLPVTGCATIDPADPAHIDPFSGNDCLTTGVGFSVVVQADAGVSLASVTAPPTITANTSFPVAVRTSMSNTGPYSPANFALSKSGAAPPGCAVTPAPPSTHNLAGSPTVIDQTWYLNCVPGGPYVVGINSAIASVSPYVLDPNPANDADSTTITVTAEADADRDGVWDLDEFNCGVVTFGVAYRPERMNGFDDDGDFQTDEALPAGSDTWDCDGDGYTGAVEAHVFQAGDRDQQQCGTTNWVADFASGGIPDSTNRITVTDITSFLAPTRHLNTNVGDNPGNVRWDTMPGKGLFTTDINIADLTSLLVTAPAMFGGNRAYGGLLCRAVGCSNTTWCTDPVTPAGMALRLETDRLVYHAGEAVQMSLIATNDGAGYVILNIPWGSCTAVFMVQSWSSNCSGLPTCLIFEGCSALLPPGSSFTISTSWNQVDGAGVEVPRGDYPVVATLEEDSCSFLDCRVPTPGAFHYIRLLP